LFISKLLAIKKIGGEFISLFGISILHSSSRILSMFIFCCADAGIIGAFSYWVFFKKDFISL
jgi:hypothetical protein